MSNIALSLDLKNGVVEIDAASVDSSVQKDAVMLNVENVHALNRVAREKAGGCVRILEEIRDFKSGIYQLLFECKKLDMEGEDAVTRVRDLQLLRVTSEVNEVSVLYHPPTAQSLGSPNWNILSDVRSYAALCQPWQGQQKVHPRDATDGSTDAA
jgi:5-hydroxyisourate hydrolase-like protein (transthyretin family)